MSECDDILEALFLGRTLDARARAHVGTCPRCRDEAPALERAARAFAADVPPSPPSALAARVLAAAAPALVLNARRATWRAVGRALAAALLPLPVLLALNAVVVRAAHALLSAVLPETLSLYVVTNYALLLAFLLALTYGAVPILAARQVAGRPEESHA